jgi:hypothetical protein
MASGGSDRDVEYALSKLLQMGTMAKYESEFVVLANRVARIFESLLISFYISGLKLDLQCLLLRLNPKTLIDPCGGNTLHKPRYLGIFEVQSFNFGRRLLQSSYHRGSL